MPETSGSSSGSRSAPLRSSLGTGSPNVDNSGSASRRISSLAGYARKNSSDSCKRISDDASGNRLRSSDSSNRAVPAWPLSPNCRLAASRRSSSRVRDVDDSMAINAVYNCRKETCVVLNVPRSRSVAWHNAVVQAGCTPHVPPVVASVAGVEAEDAAIVSRDINPPARDGGLKCHGLADIYAPKRIAGLRGERQHFPEYGGNEYFTVHSFWRAHAAAQWGRRCA